MGRRSQHSEVLRAQHPSRWKENGPSLDVVSLTDDIQARRDGFVDPQPAIVFLRTVRAEHSIGAGRQRKDIDAYLANLTIE